MRVRNSQQCSTPSTPPGPEPCRRWIAALDFAADPRTECLVARIRHKRQWKLHRLRPSIADRLFIAMLLSDAPMPNCDMLGTGRRGLFRARCCALRRNYTRAARGDDWCDAREAARVGYARVSFMRRPRPACRGSPVRAAAYRPSLRGASRSSMRTRCRHTSRAPR
jgi:hypothetical protein